MDVSAFLQALKDPAVAISAILTALVALATAVYKVKVYFSRSRLLKADAFPLPEIPSEHAIFAEDFPEIGTMLVGRGSAIREVCDQVRSSVLTFIYGESGSGKSTFLKLGLCRELANGGGWVPIYIDVWGTDWVRGPWKSLADATDCALRALGLSKEGDPPVTGETVFEQLRSSRKKTGRRPLLVFDQMDDYQNAQHTNFRRPGTQFLLTPDELCIANAFWREVRDLLLSNSDDPVHLLLATRDDAQDGLHCFDFAKPVVYQLPRLDPSDAITLIQRLTSDAVIKNPTNGFTQVMQLISRELGDEHAGAILPMQLRIALAGLGSQSGPLTPGWLEKLGGVAGLSALYLDGVLRHAPEAWPVINGMTQRLPNGLPKAIALSREQLLALIPAKVPSEQLLRKLASKRILRQRLEGSPDEMWQLYHDYLAAAIVELDRRKRKWSIILRDAAQRFRLTNGLAKRWMRLLNPATQLQLFWHRIVGRDFRYGECIGFARISLLRLVINVWTLSLAVTVFGWTQWQESRNAQEIVDAFHQGGNKVGGDKVKEFSALWRLATSRSDRLRRNVIAGFLSTPDNAKKLLEKRDSIFASIGMGSSSLKALSDLTTVPPCRVPSEVYIEACIATAEFLGEEGDLANRLIETGSSEWTLPELAAQIKGDQAERGANWLRDSLGKATGEKAALLGRSLSILAPQLKGDQAERGANRLVDLLDNATGHEAASLGWALSELAPRLKGDQAERGANRLVDLLGKASGEEAASLGQILSALAPRLKGDQVERGANRLVDLLGTAMGNEAGSLGRALSALAPRLKGDQVERGANRLVDLLNTAMGDEAGSLGQALGALVPQVKGDQTERGANRLIDLLLGIPWGSESAVLDQDLTALASRVTSDQAERIANRLVGLLSTAKQVEAGFLGHVLAMFAPKVKGDQAEQGTNRLIDLLGNATGNEAASLAWSLRELAPQVKHDQAERIANRLVDLLGTGNEAVSLGNALASLGPRLKGDQVERGASRLVDLLRGATVGAPFLGQALSALAPQLKGDQTERGANRLVDLLGKASGNEALSLGWALGQLVSQCKGSQAERGANRLIDLLANATESESESLLRVVAPLIAKTDSSSRQRLLRQIIKQRQALSCGEIMANASSKELPLMVEMLKWPICSDRKKIMQRIVEIQRVPPSEFTQALSQSRSTSTADYRKFVAWLRTQRDSEGRYFDLDSPPSWSPATH